MNKLKTIALMGIMLLLAASQAFPQPGRAGREGTVIQPSLLSVSLYKTTHLVFPYAIRSVDRGSADLLVQQAAPLENILRVKAGKANFKETNLTVITADGALYSFGVRYAESPAVLTIRLPEGSLAAEPDALFTTGGSNEAAIQRDAEEVAAKGGNGGGPKDRKTGMQLLLGGTFIRDDVMYYQLRIRNCSNIRFDTDQLHFFIRDRKRGKRTASQELELRPLYVHGSPASVAGGSEQVVVYALPKVTIPDNKHLIVQLLEKNGGRHLQLKVPNNRLLRSKVLGRL